MRKDEKAQVIAELQQALDGANNLIISGYRGLTVKDLKELRRSIAGSGARMQVVKKTLLLRALAGREQVALKDHMEGPVAITFISGDPLPVLKNMSAFAKTHQALAFTGGWIDGRTFNGSQLVEISALPPREELLSKLLASLQAPLAQLVGVLQAVPRDLVLTLQALADKRAGEAGAA